MSAIAQPRNQFSSTITCPKCGQQGHEIWEDATQTSHLDPDPHLVARSGEFYERLAKKDPYPIEVVCGRCGTVLPS